MGIVKEAASFGEPEEPKSSAHERLVGLRAYVDPEGDSASVSIEFTNQAPFRVYVPIAEAGPIVNELQNAALLMHKRQQLKIGNEASKTLELCNDAVRPQVIEILVDPLTLDRVFIFRFSDRLPISVRVGPLELPAMLMNLAAAIARSMH